MKHAEEETAHTLWVGDFNRHHPYWDDPNDTRLFTNDALRAAEYLIEAITSLGLELALPSGILTHLHNVTKKWTRLDQVFISEHSTDLVEACDTESRFRSTKMDHLPMVTKLNLEFPTAQPTVFCNFHEVDWGEFCKTLAKHLTNIEGLQQIRDQDQLNVSCETLTKAI